MSITESQRAAFLERLDRETGIFFLSLSQDRQDSLIEIQGQMPAPDPNALVYRYRADGPVAFLEYTHTGEPYVNPERSFPEED